MEDNLSEVVEEGRRRHELKGWFMWQEEVVEE